MDTDFAICGNVAGGEPHGLASVLATADAVGSARVSSPLIGLTVRREWGLG